MNPNDIGFYLAWADDCIILTFRNHRLVTDLSRLNSYNFIFKRNTQQIAADGIKVI